MSRSRHLLRQSLSGFRLVPELRWNTVSSCPLPWVSIKDQGILRKILKSRQHALTHRNNDIERENELSVSSNKSRNVQILEGSINTQYYMQFYELSSLLFKFFKIFNYPGKKLYQTLCGFLSSKNRKNILIMKLLLNNSLFGNFRIDIG